MQVYFSLVDDINLVCIYVKYINAHKFRLNIFRLHNDTYFQSIWKLIYTVE